MEPIEIPKEEIVKFLNLNFSIQEIAIKLYISYSTIYRRMKAYDLKPNFGRSGRYLTKEKLENLRNYGLTLKQIAYRMGISKSAVSCRIKKWGIKSKRKEMILIPKEILYKLYIEELKSTVDIGRDFNVSDTAINRQLRKHGIPVRSCAEGLKLKKEICTAPWRKANELLFVKKSTKSSCCK